MRRIALVMIARNEARCIARCLRSAHPFVDEMIVLDTGSTDATATIARAEGARVHAFTWADDFALARNAALDLSRADWNLVLDADEWLDQGTEALAALRHAQPDFIGRLEVCSTYADQRGTHAASSWLPRLLPAGVRYEGRIHEQPQAALPRRDLPIRVQHDGYLPPQMAAKGGRNRQLLERAVAAHPGDPYLRYQLGKDHEVHDRFEPARQAYALALRQLGATASREPPWRHDLVLRALYACKACGLLEEAIHLAQAEMPNWPDSPDFHFVLGDVLLDFAAAHPEQAGEILPMIEAAWTSCLRIGENPSLEGAVHGRGSHLARHNLDLLRQTVAAL